MKNHAGFGDVDGGRRSKRRRWSTHMVALVAIALSFMMIPTAGAQGGSLEVPVSTVVRTAPGVETLLASLEVPTEFIGTSCGVETASENNRSVHPGNNIVVASGGASVTLFDVESTSGQISTAEAPLTLGSEVTITLVMGPDGVFSGGAVVVFDCAPPTTTSTTTTSTTSTTTSTTTTSTTTTSTTTTTTTLLLPPPPPPPPTPPTPPTHLAVTGAGEMLVIAFAGIVLLDLGYLLFSTRRPAPVRGRDD